ncbi:MAG: RloB family protein [Chitinophagales bacterium]
MPKKKRGYKKGEQHKDARLFVIVAEGEREDAYFKWFHEKNLRISVEIVMREENKSAPKHFLERLDKYIDSTGWREKDGDLVWFVLDVDRWERKEIEDLRIHCEQKNNWNIAISNPCFEVWVIFHLQKEIEDKGEMPKDLKHLIPQLIQGGFNLENICPLIETATENAKNADANSAHHFPYRMKTKVYQLAEQMLELLGKNWQT